MIDEFDIYNTERKNGDGYRNYDSLFLDVDETDFKENPQISERIEVIESQKISWKTLNRTQKVILSILGIVGIGTIIFSLVQFNDILNLPFPDFSSDQYAQEQPGQAVDAEELRNKDTDQDKLSDYLELYVYYTSPYIQDSDSDGINDYDEVAAGNDPNCPEGTNCFDPETGTSYASTEQYDNTSALNTGSTINPGASESFDESFVTGGLAADDLREYLMTQGATEEMLDAVSDEDLLLMYNDALGTVQENSDSGDLDLESLPDETVEETVEAGDSVFMESDFDVDELQKMTGSELRQELVRLGIDPSLLSDFDDETLRQLFMDSLAQTQE